MYTYGKFLGATAAAACTHQPADKTFATVVPAAIALFACCILLPNSTAPHTPHNLPRTINCNKNHIVSGATCCNPRRVLNQAETFNTHNLVSSLNHSNIALRSLFASAREKSVDTLIPACANNLPDCSDNHSNIYLSK